MSVKTSNYGAARSILALAELTLWCGIGLGVIVAIVAAGAASRGFGSSGLLAAVPGIFISVICFLGIVIVQMAKATVDSADYGYQMLGVARDQLSISQQALRHSEQAISYAARATTEPKANTADVTGTSGKSDVSAANPNESVPLPSFMRSGENEPTSPRVTDYRDALIERTINGYTAMDKTFETLELAKDYIDGQRLREAPTSQQELLP